MSVNLQTAEEYRKDKLKEAGHTGPWPTEIIVTVEVPSE